MNTSTTAIGTMPSQTSRRGFMGILSALIAPMAALKASEPAQKLPIKTNDKADSPTLQDQRDAWIREWSSLPRIPIRESHDPLVAAILDHSLHGRSITLFYSGGSHPGRMRRFSPDLLFRHERCHHLYVSGFCHKENAPRILRLDRIALT